MADKINITWSGWEIKERHRYNKFKLYLCKLIKVRPEKLYLDIFYFMIDSDKDIVKSGEQRIVRFNNGYNGYIRKSDKALGCYVTSFWYSAPPDGVDYNKGVPLSVLLNSLSSGIHNFYLLD